MRIRRRSRAWSRRRPRPPRDPEEVIELTGFRPGAVAPFPLPAGEFVIVESGTSSGTRCCGPGPALHGHLVAPRAGRARPPHARSRRGPPAREFPHNQGSTVEQEEPGHHAGDREDLDERRARRLGRRDRSRRCPRAPLRHGRVRGHPVLRDAEGARRSSGSRPHAAPARLGAPALHGHPVPRRRAPRRDARPDPRERAARLLRPADRVLRVRRSSASRRRATRSRR